jgi:TonB family protein
MVPFLIAGSVAAQNASPFGPMIKDFGGATLLTRELMSFEDYPAEAAARGDQGRVIVGFEINAKGRVEDCVVQTSSGYASLDKIPCRLLERKARFRLPAQDEGVSKPVRGLLSMDFWTPD